MMVPNWLHLELATAHPGVELKWMPYGERKVFVLPMIGDAFYRMPIKRLGGHVLYRRHITPASPQKWALHPHTYFPDSDCVTDSRWVAFQTNRATGDTVKIFDLVDDEGRLLPLDRRVMEALAHRDRTQGAHEKALGDVEGSADAADAAATAALEEAGALEMLDRARHAVLRKSDGGGACITPGPEEAVAEYENLGTP